MSCGWSGTRTVISITSTSFSEGDKKKKKAIFCNTIYKLYVVQNRYQTFLSKGPAILCTSGSKVSVTNFSLISACLKIYERDQQQLDEVSCQVERARSLAICLWYKKQKQANTSQRRAKTFSWTARDGILKISRVAMGYKMPGHTTLPTEKIRKKILWGYWSIHQSLRGTYSQKPVRDLKSLGSSEASWSTPEESCKSSPQAVCFFCWTPTHLSHYFFFTPILVLLAHSTPCSPPSFRLLNTHVSSTSPKKNISQELRRNIPQNYKQGSGGGERGTEEQWKFLPFCTLLIRSDHFSGPQFTCGKTLPQSVCQSPLSKGSDI